MTAPPRQVVAAFDFDGTVTHRETLSAFLWQVTVPWRFALNTFLLLPTLLGYLLRLIPNSVAKERLLRRFLAGMSREVLAREGERFAHERIPALLRPQAVTRLAWHRRQGHRCVVVSASIEDYVAPWALAAGFDAVIATRLETDGVGRVTGRYDGGNCYGAEKARRLRALLGEAAVELYAYGDSRGDREMLAMADHAYYREMPGEGKGG